MEKKQITDLLKWLEQEKLHGKIEFVNKSVIAEEYLQHLKKEGNKGGTTIGRTGNTTDDLPF